MNVLAPSKKLPAIIGLLFRRSIPLDIIQGLFVGWGLALVVTYVVINAQVQKIMTTVNGWQTTQACGVPSGWLVQAACARALPAVNAPQEAVYWQATADARGASLDGSRRYMLHFPPGGLPPVNAFWSITIAGAHRLMVENAAHRYSVSDRSGLQANADGSVDVYVQPAAPVGHEANWLPTPEGGFMLWLRAYGPKPAILDGTWRPPALTQVQP